MHHALEFEECLHGLRAEIRGVEKQRISSYAKEFVFYPRRRVVNNKIKSSPLISALLQPKLPNFRPHIH